MRIEEVIHKLKELKPFLQEKYKVSEIGIFGSFARGEHREESDLDIIVEFLPDAKISLIDFIELENLLSDIFLRKVDLVEKSALKRRIGELILKETISV